MRRLLRLLSIPVLCAAAGFALAHYGTRTTARAQPVALSGQTTGASFTIRYPAGWAARPATAALRGALGDAVLLAPGTGATSSSGSSSAGSSMAIGVARPARAGTFSTAVRALVSTVPAPQVVSLAGTDFLRYAGVTPRIGTGSDWVYLLPTTAGTITAICSAPKMTAAIAAGCERMLRSLRVLTGSVLSVGVDVGYALEVNHILGAVNRARAATGGALRAADPKQRAAAAGAIAAADRRAAREVARLSGVPVSVANSGLASALRRGGRAYGDLAAAAAAADPVRYAAAQGAVGRAERALRRAFRRLSEVGYRIG